MLSIPIAQKKDFNTTGANQGKFVIEPLYPGYGLTLGNALRRVLLSSLEGTAITFIRLQGVDHEFSAVKGVKEDAVDISLNLKQVRFEVDGDFEEPIKMELNKTGAGEVLAGDFKKTAGVKITNPELVIATITEDQAEFNLEAWLEKGRGYLPTEMMKTRDKEIGMIAIDAFFSPVKRVAVDTENVRVGEMTNWDRLLLYIETDGTVTPEEALKKSAQILIDQFSFFLDYRKELKEEAELNLDTSNQSIVSREESEEPKPKKRGRKKKNDTTEV
ncbi:MAG TPA: DNA-directed RNA polymerase subunit alpha [bacterium]|mgnify:CR=1 FL=1|nr:DNA-directed RNA polymerase subunit alpha [bacterium]HPL95442.1 DNA-directed RNA polymerase subunit alpha [bacterium]